MDTNTRRRGVIKREDVHDVDEHDVDEHEARARTRPPDAPGAEPPGASPAHVRLLRLDEHTQALEFTCSCGEVSLIEIQSEKKP